MAHRPHDLVDVCSRSHFVDTNNEAGIVFGDGKGQVVWGETSE